MSGSIESKWLYVMQNQHGAIKVGRSADPASRLKALEKSIGCEIRLIAALPEHGEQEERVHIRLRRYHFTGEWFSGCASCQKAISQTLRLTKVRFPFSWKRARAEQWRRTMHLASVLPRMRKERVRLIGLLKAVETGLHNGAVQRGGHWLDFSIWFEMNQRINRLFFGDDRPIDATQLKIAPYTTDLSAALSLWPEEKRPTQWSEQHVGSTVELNCCIAGLGELWQIDSERIKPRLN
jgi:hypothetical protein